MQHLIRVVDCRRVAITAEEPVEITPGAIGGHICARVMSFYQRTCGHRFGRHFNVPQIAASSACRTDRLFDVASAYVDPIGDRRTAEGGGRIDLKDQVADLRRKGDQGRKATYSSKRQRSDDGVGSGIRTAVSTPRSQRRGLDKGPRLKTHWSALTANRISHKDYRNAAAGYFMRSG